MSENDEVITKARFDEVMSLTDGANRFLHALRDLGFLDGRLEAEVLDRIMGSGGGKVDFQDIRRELAILAFERRNSGEIPTGLLDFLDVEWKLIFH